MEICDYIKSIPVLRVLIPFVTGIITGYRDFVPQQHIPLYFLIILGLTIILFLLNSLLLRPVTGRIRGVLITLLFFMTGTGLPSLFPEDIDIPEQHPYGYYLCRALDYPVERKKTFRLSVQAKGRFDKDSISGDSFSLFAYLRKDSIPLGISPGDMLIIRMRPVRPLRNGNPHEFDYRKYLFRKGVYYQGFVREGDWHVVGKSKKKLRYLPLNLRFQYTERLKGIIARPEDFGILSALSVGVRDYVDEETRTAYSSAGAMHVLAVSGLHVGLVWYVLSILFVRLRSYRNTRFLYWLIMTGLLWLYVMTTGMSPSVTRAGIMLTLVITSGMLKRGSSGSNPVFLSAFFLLAFNPYLLLDVGFQFSYLAVFGIIFIQPGIKKLIKTNNPVLGYLWELTAVSVAAQAGTFIPALYYFNKFPVYFLLSNYMVIPLVTVILVCIIISVFFWFIPPLFILISRLSAFFTYLMNKGVRLIESLPYSSIDQIYIDEIDVILLSLSLICFVLFLRFTGFRFFLVSILLWSIFLLYGGFRDKNRMERGFAAVHNIPGILALDISFRDRHYLITSVRDPAVEKQISANCNGFWLYERAGNPVYFYLEDGRNSGRGLEIIPVHDTGNFIIMFHHLVIYIIQAQEGEYDYITGKKTVVDLVIINTGKKPDIPDFLSYPENEKMVMSSGYRRNFGAFNPDKSNDKNFNLHDVYRMGAFVKYFK